MRLVIESTDLLTTMDGTPCKVFVHRLAVHNDHPETQAEFERQLAEQLPPLRSVPLSAIL